MYKLSHTVCHLDIVCDAEHNANALHIIATLLYSLQNKDKERDLCLFVRKGTFLLNVFHSQLVGSSDL